MSQVLMIGFPAEYRADLADVMNGKPQVGKVNLTIFKPAISDGGLWSDNNAVECTDEPLVAGKPPLIWKIENDSNIYVNLAQFIQYCRYDAAQALATYVNHVMKDLKADLRLAPVDGRWVLVELNTISDRDILDIAAKTA